MKCIEDEIPFEVPEGWAWCRLGATFETLTGRTPSTKDTTLYGNEYPFYKPADLEAGFYVYDAVDKVSEKGYLTGSIVKRNSVLVTCIGATIGKTGYVRNNGICNQQINAILPAKDIFPEYTYLSMCSGFIQTQIKSNASATTLPILNKSKFDKLLFVLPPITQQEKIILKVKNLFAAIDNITISNYELKNNIVTVKSVLLNLAIRGKLVPQDPNDEPASVLIERIRAEKEYLVKQGKIRRDKKDSIIFKGDDNSYYEQIENQITCIQDEIPFDIPDNWAWCRLKCLGAPIENAFVDGPFGSNLKTEHYTENKEVRIVQLNNIGIFEWKNSVEKYTTYRHAKGISRCISYPGDIIIAKMMPAGRTIILPNINNIYVISSDCVRLRPSRLVCNEYLLYMLNSQSINALVLENVQGIGRTRTSLSKLKEILVPIPPISEQLKIADKIKKFYLYADGIEMNST